MPDLCRRQAGITEAQANQASQGDSAVVRMTQNLPRIMVFRAQITSKTPVAFHLSLAKNVYTDYKTKGL